MILPNTNTNPNDLGHALFGQTVLSQTLSTPCICNASIQGSLTIGNYTISAEKLATLLKLLESQYSELDI
jgi:hypothetical protein